jgi:hypothetical protein
MAKTIHTILYDDVLEGSKIITMDNCVCQLFDIKRDYDALIRDEKDVLSRPALYILLNRDSRKAYIGQTDDFPVRRLFLSEGSRRTGLMVMSGFRRQ